MPEEPKAQKLELTLDTFTKLVEGIAAKVAEVSGQAAATAHQAITKPEDPSQYHRKSVFNPLGEKEHPRPELVRDIFWVGYRLQKEELTYDEIVLLNQLKPGYYMDGFFKVQETEPGMPSSPLRVTFPCQTPDQRSNLARFDRGRGMVDMLEQMVPPEARGASR